GLVLIGLASGEREQLPERITPGAAAAFCYLLIVGSLVGFVAYNWLLGHVTAAQASTYTYVNPAVAVLVGWADGEEMTVWLLGGIGVILAGVALVRSIRGPHLGDACPTQEEADADEALPVSDHQGEGSKSSPNWRG